MAVDYGHDLFGIADLDPAGLELGGNMVLAQACARRLITTRGTLIDDSNYGYNLTQFLGDDLSTAQLAIVRSSVALELLKDERVIGADVSAVFQPTTHILTVVVLVTGASGTFQFVLTVNELAAPLLQVAA